MRDIWVKGRSPNFSLKEESARDPLTLTLSPDRGERGITYEGLIAAMRFFISSGVTSSM